jgi:hypothetical protein
LDLAAGTLSRFAWITPDLCHDMHSCNVSAGDTWLSDEVPAILAALESNGILIITFDEGKTNQGCCDGTAAGGRIPTIIAGPGAADGRVITSDSTGYSILRLIENSLGLAYLRQAGTAPSIDGFACSSPPCT